MEKAILGTKIGMTQIFGEGGVVIPVTVVMAGPCVVTQKKTVETDGYEAVQVGFGDVKEKHLNKPQLGHFKKADTANKKYVRELRLQREQVLKFQVLFRFLQIRKLSQS